MASPMQEAVFVRKFIRQGCVGEERVMKRKSIVPPICMVVVCLVSGPLQRGVAADAPAAGSASTTPESPSPEGDLARKMELMQSERWRRAIFEFGQWLSSQTIYNAEEVTQIKADFNARVVGMSSYELEYLLDDLDAKLAILATPEAQDAKAWLGEYLAAMSDQRRARLLEQVPNRATMTSEQLRQEIDRIQRQRTELQQQQQAFATRRQDLVDAAAANRQQTADAAAAAAARRQMAGTYSPYRDNEPTVGSPPFSDLPERSGVGMVIGPFGPYITFGL
jgi:hypothetical protein